MRYLLILSALIALGFASLGCIGYTAVRGTQGKAYVVKGHMFGTSMWNCDASSGKPKCYKVIKQQ